MSNIVFKIIMYMFLFNMSVGIVITAFPDVFTPENRAGLFYRANQSQSFTTGMQSVISPSGELENAGDQSYRLLDLTIIGFIERALNTVKSLLYGFVQLLASTIGAWIATDNEPLSDFLFSNPFGIFYSLTTISYIYGAFYLWTGKDLTGN